jgi:hypothetical protein
MLPLERAPRRWIILWLVLLLGMLLLLLLLSHFTLHIHYCSSTQAIEACIWLGRLKLEKAKASGREIR